MRNKDDKNKDIFIMSDKPHYTALELKIRDAERKSRVRAIDKSMGERLGSKPVKEKEQAINYIH